jgi:hypothetical protein
MKTNPKEPLSMPDETIVGGPFIRYLPARGTVFMVVGKIRGEKIVRIYCPRILRDQWGLFTVGAFRRRGNGNVGYWTERIDNEVLVTGEMSIFEFPVERWMEPE